MCCIVSFKPGLGLDSAVTMVHRVRGRSASVRSRRLVVGYHLSSTSMNSFFTASQLPVLLLKLYLNFISHVIGLFKKHGRKLGAEFGGTGKISRTKFANDLF